MTLPDFAIVAFVEHEDWHGSAPLAKLWHRGDAPNLAWEPQITAAPARAAGVPYGYAERDDPAAVDRIELSGAAGILDGRFGR